MEYFSSSMWKAKTIWSLVFQFPLVSEALIKPQQVRLWLNSFPWEQTLLRNTECSGVFQNNSFSSPHAKSMRRFLSDIHRENLVGSKTHKSGWLPSDWVSLKTLTLRVVHSEPPAIHQIQFRFPYPSTVSQGGFTSWVFSSVSCDSLYLPVSLSNLGAALRLWPNFLTHLTWVVDFSVCSAFTC